MNQNTSGNTATFAVLYTSSSTTERTFSFTCSSKLGVTCGTVTPSSATLSGPDDERLVTVKFNVGAIGGTLTLTAKYGTGSIQDAGYYNVVLQGAPTVALRHHNRDNIDRSLCLTAGAGEAAAWSCGDLVVTHAMPGYATMGRERALTLVHNSGTAYPRPAVAAVVTRPSAIAPPSTVYAELRVAGVPQTSATYNGSAWISGTTAARQIVLDFNGGLLTDLLPESWST